LGVVIKMDETIVPDYPEDLDKIKRTLLGTEKGWKLTFDAIPDLIAILDSDHRVVTVNKAMAEKLNTSPDACVGTICYQVVHHSEEPPEICPHQMLLKDGLEHKSEVDEKNLGGYFIVTASPIKDDYGNILGSIHIAHDITERKKMENRLEKTLEEKDTLMKEIYHRVKNNLMVISSLLSLQSRYIKDKETQDIFKQTQNRAESMALIHEKLYQSTDLKKIDFGDYIKKLSNALYKTYVMDDSQIKLNVDVEDIMLDIDTSIPLGLIFNELVTNSLKHAFPQDKIGEINIKFYSKDDKYILEVKDNGIGFSDDMDYKNTDSLGLRLVTNLTEQIDGVIELNKTSGTSFKIIFTDGN
jgi:PAS domain S-box-containing protein